MSVAPTPANTPLFVACSDVQPTTPEHVVLDIGKISLDDLRLPATMFTVSQIAHSRRTLHGASPRVLPRDAPLYTNDGTPKKSPGTTSPVYNGIASS